MWNLLNYEDGEEFVVVFYKVIFWQ